MLADNRQLMLVFSSQASHAAYSTADSKTFLVFFVVISPVKQCFSLNYKALTSSFSTVFLSVATITICFNLFLGGLAMYGSISQLRAKSDVAWYLRA